MARTSASSIWRELEKILQQNLTSGSPESFGSITNYIRLGADGSMQIQSPTTGEWRNATKAVMKKFLGPIYEQLQQGVSLGRITINTIMPVSKIKGGSAFGNYFEYAVYEAISRRLKELDPAVNIPTPRTSFIAQGGISSVIPQTPGKKSKNYEVQTALAYLNKAAEVAADLIVNEVGVGILQVMAGNNPRGDLKLGDVILELKYYEDPSQITWWSFSDTPIKRINNGIGLEQSLKSQGIWDKNTDDPKNDPWVKLVMTEGVPTFFQQIANSCFKNDAADFFTWLLYKGKTSGNAAQQLAKKRIVIAESMNATRGKVTVHLTLNLSALIAMVKNDISMNIGQSINFASQTVGGEIGSMIVLQENIAKLTKARKGNWDDYYYKFYITNRFWSQGLSL